MRGKSEWVSIGDLERAGAILAIQDGNHGEKHPKATDYVDDGIPFIMANDVTGNTVDIENSAKLPQALADKLRIGFSKKGDVLLTHKGTIGSTAIVNTDLLYLMLTPQVTYYRTDQSKLLNRYLMYAFQEPIFQKTMKSLAQQATRPYIGITAQRKLKVRWMPIKEQQQIATILSAYDDLIENNRRRIQLLEQAAWLLYKEWFVHLRFPGHEHVTITEGVPERWEKKPLGELVEIKKGKNITKDTVNEGEVPVVAGGLTPAYFHDTSNAIGPVITISASGANSGYVNIYHKEIWASDCSYISQESTDYPYYYFLLLKSKQREIFGLQRGAAQPHVYSKDLMGLAVISPPDRLVRSFEETISNEFLFVKILIKQSKFLTQARDLLLPRLMNGKVTV